MNYKVTILSIIWDSSNDFCSITSMAFLEEYVGICSDSIKYFILYKPRPFSCKSFASLSKMIQSEITNSGGGRFLRITHCLWEDKNYNIHATTWLACIFPFLSNSFLFFRFFLSHYSLIFFSPGEYSLFITH